MISLLVMTLILLGSVLFVIPGLIAATIYGLYAPVVIVNSTEYAGAATQSNVKSQSIRNGAGYNADSVCPADRDR